MEYYSTTVCMYVCTSIAYFISVTMNILKSFVSLKCDFKGADSAIFIKSKMCSHLRMGCLMNC